MLEKLDRATRLRLLRVVTAVAWVDGHIHPNERAFVLRLVDRMKLPPEERATALSYLDRAPHPAEADPSKIPPDYRAEVAELARAMVSADGETADEEAECLSTLEAVLLGH